MNELLLKVENISKHFGGLQALNYVQLDVRKGEVHALVGENGAGKSTLMKILGGILMSDSGKIIYKGKETIFINPQQSISAGIALIHQELSLMSHLNIIENVYMGRMNSRYGIIKWQDMEQKTKKLLQRVGLNMEIFTKTGNLSISQRQLVEIAKALSIDANLIIMDEPNSSLTAYETEHLFKVIEDLKSKGISLIYVSHKIDEVLRISNRISILRDGHYVCTIEKKDATKDNVIQMMVGRKLKHGYLPNKNISNEIALEVQNLTGKGFKNVSFKLFKGEILGFAGLVGAGRSEVANAIFAARPFSAGKVFLFGKEIRFKSPADAIKYGLAMVQEDRKNLSLFMNLFIKFNMSLTLFPILNKYGILKHDKIHSMVSEFVNKLNIKLGSLNHPVSSLSGGNQQKTVLSRWLLTNPKILILDEPTHGIDIGTKSEIYELMRNLTQKGISIIFISSELPEILSVSDRVVVMHDKRITCILNREEMTEQKIGSALIN